MERTKAAAVAAEYPPHCLAGLSCDVLNKDDCSLDYSVQFALRCGSCPGKSFRLFGFPLVAPDPSPYYGIAAGEILFRPPHRLECIRCGQSFKLFDPQTHGYDGVLNGGCAYETSVDNEVCSTNEYNISAAFTYNIEYEELTELAEEACVQVSDLFDWIEIKGSPVYEGEEIQLSYECA